jgi:macrolide-specific efflux system membrane fusion protein
MGVVGLPLALLGRAGFPHGGERASAIERARVTRRDIGTVVKATGIVRPMVGAEVRVGSRVSGVVRRLPVRIGDAVAKGQLLAELSAQDLAARRDQAKAALASARASFGYARADLARKRELAAAALVSQSELDLAERAFAVARLAVDEAEAGLAYARTQLGYARIVAPISGIVASVTTQEGETVSASLAAPTFVTILDLDRLEVWAYVDETDIGRVRVGQQARFTVDTYADHEFAGRVTAIYPQAEIRDNVVNYVAVLHLLPERERVLRPEMTTAVTIAIETREGVLTVPRRALRREGGRSFVLCPRGDGFERRFVTTGSRDESDWEVTDGLREGDEVVVGEAPVDGAPKEQNGGRS